MCSREWAGFAMSSRWLSRARQIPNLLMDHDRWKITALCDLSPHSLQYCGVRSGVPPERHFTAV